MSIIDINQLVTTLKKIQCHDTNLSFTQRSSDNHQKSVVNVLLQNGFSPTTKDYNNKKLNDNCYFCLQPFGKQRAPDIILIRVKNGAKHIAKLELKKGNKKIMWNDGFPKEDTLYLFTDYKRSKTNLFCKHHLLSTDTELLFLKQCETIRKLNEKCKNINGFRFYTRKANSQNISDTLIHQNTTKEIEAFLKTNLGFNF